MQPFDNVKEIFGKGGKGDHFGWLIKTCAIKSLEKKVKLWVGLTDFEIDPSQIIIILE